jgi:hypothetical protein
VYECHVKLVLHIPPRLHRWKCCSWQLNLPPIKQSTQRWSPTRTTMLLVRCNTTAMSLNDDAWVRLLDKHLEPLSTPRCGQATTNHPSCDLITSSTTCSFVFCNGIIVSPTLSSFPSVESREERTPVRDVDYLRLVGHVTQITRANAAPWFGQSLAFWPTNRLWRAERGSQVRKHNFNKIPIVVPLNLWLLASIRALSSRMRAQ